MNEDAVNLAVKVGGSAGKDAGQLWQRPFPWTDRAASFILAAMAGIVIGYEAQMTIIDTFYASGGPDVRLFTLELTCPAWAAPILICNGFTDRTCVTEDARTLTFIAAAIDVALPKKDSRGAQSMTIAIDNVSGEAQAKIDEAMTAEARVSATLRTYLLSDLTAPAEAPYRMTVQNGSIEQLAVQLSAGFFDLINVAWPRLLYTTKNAPGLKYL